LREETTVTLAWIAERLKIGGKTHLAHFYAGNVAQFIKSNILLTDPMLWTVHFGPTTRITDRRRKRALAAYPESKKPGASKLKRLAAVRVHPFC
jgi:hypothetical protein